MVRHIVLFGMKPSSTEHETEELMAKIRGLPEIIPEIRFFEVIRDEVCSERSATFGLLSHFDDMEGLTRYREHPAHQAVLVNIRAQTEWVKSWDYTIEQT